MKMNSNERKMLDVLKELRDEHNVIAVKAEFEAEGSRTDELVMLNEVIFRADMKLFIKIGGCEAVRDLDQCRLLGASGIMAPMIETPFAMHKFVGAAQKVYGDRMNDIEWIINTCLSNIDDILEEGRGMLDTISIGRVDLSSSMGIGRPEINSDKIFEASYTFASKAKKQGLKVGFGGGISFDAIPFIQKMDGVCDKFETRKIVYAYMKDEKQLKRAILKGMEFETLYLENKCAFYDRMANEDRVRLQMLYKRLETARSQIVD